MNELDMAEKSLLEPVAAALARQEVGFALAGWPLRRLISGRAEAVVEFLALRVRELSAGELTVRRPASRLLYGCVQDASVALVLCKVGAPGVVSDQQHVIRAWFLTSGGLLPAAFDHMPKEMGRYAVAMNGRR
jgi:hypothetical protein